MYLIIVILLVILIVKGPSLMLKGVIWMGISAYRLISRIFHVHCVVRGLPFSFCKLFRCIFVFRAVCIALKRVLELECP